MNEPDAEVLRNAVFEVIENQIHDNTPPETKETYDRLRAESHSKQETMKLIGCVVASEIFGVVKEGRTYDQAAYVRALQALPKLPWES
jgi:peroxiredoxin family protein